MNAKLNIEHKICIHKIHDFIMETIEMLLCFTTKHLKRGFFFKIGCSHKLNKLSYINSGKLKFSLFKHTISVILNKNKY
jgi:hypothetical protein